MSNETMEQQLKNDLALLDAAVSQLNKHHDWTGAVALQALAIRMKAKSALGPAPARAAEAEVYSIPGDPTMTPCPFCGPGDTLRMTKTLRDGYVGAEDDEDAHAYAVRCVCCAVEGPWTKSESRAIQRWNMRPNGTPARTALPFDAADVAMLRKKALEYVGSYHYGAFNSLASRLESALKDHVPDAGKMVGDENPTLTLGGKLIEARAEIESLRRELSEERMRAAKFLGERDVALAKAERLMHQSEAFEAEAERLRGELIGLVEKWSNTISGLIAPTSVVERMLSFGDALMAAHRNIATPPAPDPSGEPVSIPSVLGVGPMMIGGDDTANRIQGWGKPSAEPAEDDVHGFCNKCGYSGPCKGGRWRMRHPNCDYSAMPIDAAPEPALPTYDPAKFILLDRVHAGELAALRDAIPAYYTDEQLRAFSAVSRALEGGA